MARSPQRTPVPGPAFIRLLASLTEGDIPASSPALSDRLSEWFDWTRAVTLSRALDGRLPSAPEDAPRFDSAEQAECARVRAALVENISQAPASSAHAANTAAAGFAPFGQRYLQQQRAMQAATGRLRGRLRDMLALESEALARLAEVDAVMEQTLSPREHSLLARIPALLEGHFERLRANACGPSPDTDASDAAAAGPWLDTFRRDLQGLLLAELDVRFHPIEGLLAALRPR